MQLAPPKEGLGVRDLRNSEMKDLERCPIRWHWGWNLGLKPLRTNTKLWVGIGVHEALADWYRKGKRRGPHPAEGWNNWVKAQDEASDRSIAQNRFDGDEELELEYADAVDLITYMLEQYVVKYGKDEQFSFIATEQTFNMPILTPKSYMKQMRRKQAARLVGTWDGVYRDLDTGEIWLIEHKTSAVGGVPRFQKMLPIDTQTNTYFMSATYILRKKGILKPNENISGILFNWLEKYKPSATTTEKMGEDGIVRNKPNKSNYYEALKDMPSLGLELTKLPSLVVLAEMAEDVGVRVLGDPSKNQPKQPGDYFKRDHAFRSDGDLHFTYNEIAERAVERENMLLGISPVTKNPTMDCSWDCSFFKLCELHTAGEDWEEYMSMAYVGNDPYADHNNQKKA